MSVYRNVRFAQIGYAAIFDNEKQLFSSDRNALMKYLEKQVSVRTAMKINIESLKSFEHRFSYCKVRYRATFTPFHENFFLCRVYPEDSYMKCAYSDLYKYISDMRMNAAEMVCTARRLDEDLCSKGEDGELRDHAKKLLEAAEKEYASASEILKMFDKQHIFEYVPIVLNLERTKKRIRLNNDIMKRNVVLDVDIKQSVARVNYLLFEACITCLAKLYYKTLQEGETATLRVRGTDTGSLSVRTEYEFGNKINEADIELDIRLIKCIFEALDGSSVLDIMGNRLVFRGEVPVSLSNYFNRIKGIYQEFDENEPYEPEEENIFDPALAKRDRNRPLELHSNTTVYKEDMLELMWSIAMNSLYEKLIS